MECCLPANLFAWWLLAVILSQQTIGAAWWLHSNWMSLRSFIYVERSTLLSAMICTLYKSQIKAASGRWVREGSENMNKKPLNSMCIHWEKEREDGLSEPAARETGANTWKQVVKKVRTPMSWVVRSQRSDLFLGRSHSLVCDFTTPAMHKVTGAVIMSVVEEPRCVPSNSITRCFSFHFS